MWRVASGALLETPDASPTLIKIDLLEAAAFLAAWSLLLMTVTANVVNRSRDIESAVDETTRQVEEYKAVIKRHEEGHPDIQGEVESLEAKASDLVEGMIQLKKENDRVTEENRQLRRQLEARQTEGV